MENRDQKDFETILAFCGEDMEIAESMVNNHGWFCNIYGTWGDMEDIKKTVLDFFIIYHTEKEFIDHCTEYAEDWAENETEFKEYFESEKARFTFFNGLYIQLIEC